MAIFQCNKCATTFTRKDALTRHMRKQHGPTPELDLNQQPAPSNATPPPNCNRSLSSNTSQPNSTKSTMNCPNCNKAFKERKGMLRHQREVHEKLKKTTCAVCGKAFARINDMIKHMETHTRKRPMPNLDEPITPKKPKRQTRCTQTALQNSLQTLTLRPSNSDIDPALFLRSQLSNITEAIDITLEEHSGLKVWMSLNLVFQRATNPQEQIEAHFNSSNRVILRGSNIGDEIAAAFPQILHNIEEFIQRGSGWVITDIGHLDIHLAKYQPLRGSSYIALPDHIAKKEAIINVQNDDDQCFKWSVLACLHPLPSKANANRVTNYTPFANELTFTTIPFPVKVSDVPQFARQNSLSINVYELENGDPCPLYISKKPNCPHIDLLLLTKGSKQHYCWIKNLDRLLSDQNKHKEKKHFCPLCLLPQYSAERKILHLQLCQKNEPTKVEMPEDKWLHFKNLHRMQRVPYIMYADFECLTEKLPGCAPPNAASFTERYQKHTPCGFGLVGVMNCCGEADIEPPTIYRGEDSVRKFLETILQQNEEYQTNFSEAKPLDLSPDEQAQHDMATQCYLCNKTFQEDECGVRDHCHFCGKYRGAAHNKCNMGFRLSRGVVVAIHNLRRYDGHLIMQKVGLLCNEMGLQLDCIPKGMEDYLSFTLKRRKTQKRRQTHQNAASAFIDEEAEASDEDDEDGDEDGEGKWKIRFVDSFQFLTSSLEGLVDNLAKEGLNKFLAMSQEFPTADELKKLVRKGVYSYDYMDSWQRFEETQLPSKEDFWSQLNDSDITDADHQHAQEVWNHFSIQNLGEYHDLYLKTDVLLLADVFESFRSFCLQHYGLDPTHYYTLPSFAWDACLKKTNVWLELLQEPDMYLFFEQGIKGDISMITHRYAKANNPLVPDFNPQDPLSWIMYLNANNLYGWTMVQKLPVRDFKWLSHEKIDEINWTYIPDGRMGYVLEVDLEYPEDLHESHNDYPLAPERVQVTPDMLSPYAQALCEDLGKTPSKVEKLVPNLRRKERYIVHYRNLSLYMRLYMKVHRVLSFTQRAWMKPYIIFNTEMRKQAKCDFEKDLFKLLNNAVFGKTMENVRAYQSIQLVTEHRKFCKLVAKPRYNRSVIFSEDLVAVSMKRVSVQLCKPVYIGFCVLDLSKYLMYEFHYMYVVPKYGPKAKLLFTDTDSLCYHICTDNIYKDMQLEKFRFDTSDYPQNHFLHSTQNKKVLGKMKDETAGSPISEFCGLRAKMYSFVCDGIDKKRAKGIKKSVVKKCISHVDYVNTLRERTFMYHNMNLIRSSLHELYSIKLNKTSLSAYDDKRYLLDDGVTSLAYGHYKI